MAGELSNLMRTKFLNSSHRSQDTQLEVQVRNDFIKILDRFLTEPGQILEVKVATAKHLPYVIDAINHESVKNAYVVSQVDPNTFQASQRSIDFDSFSEEV